LIFLKIVHKYVFNSNVLVELNSPGVLVRFYLPPSCLRSKRFLRFESGLTPNQFSIHFYLLRPEVLEELRISSPAILSLIRDGEPEPFPCLRRVFDPWRRTWAFSLRYHIDLYFTRPRWVYYGGNLLSHLP